MLFHLGFYILLTTVQIEVFCDCGIAETDGNPSNDNEDGIGAKVFPWLVAIYSVWPDNGVYRRCFGDLISPDVVITASRCIRKTPTDLLQLYVVAGNRTPYHLQEHFKFPRTRVKTLYKGAGYDVWNGIPDEDIMWLVLEHPLNITPACIDLKDQQDTVQLPVGLVGQVFLQSLVKNESMETAGIGRMRVIDSSESDCYRLTTEVRRHNLSLNPLCARVLREPWPRFDSIGSGFYSKHDGRWYLRAIITHIAHLYDSVGLYQVALMLNVQRFADQIKRSGSIKNCGTVTLPVNTLIVNGQRAEQGGHPWHVAIYKKNSTGFYDQICGGSLVSSNVLISAAHCFYDDNTKQQMDASDFAVAAGKHYRPYVWPEPFVQKSPVQTIHISSRYYGVDALYVADIAWLILQHPFDLTTNVKPICLETSSQHESEHLQIGQVGKVAGWGITSNGFASHELREINAPFVNYEECIFSLPRYSRPYVTVDKFCAGYLNGTTLCNGDSGGGLAFQRNGRWYLVGIVSVNPVVDTACNTHTYTAFTNVKRYSDELYEFTYSTTNN